ncbi:MAG TPA: dTDP-4-dehydrorhamnose 3,5-epimerase family protein [Burkholderiaceae bacterium]|nr:dTDP-4-dehydrorhamnose 3,5-epimerase family protein [Burkholderiaceae bacterium]
MIFTPLSIEGAYKIELDRKEDERGWFARAWCRDEFEMHGLEGEMLQSSFSYNKSAGTLRGMHLQRRPSFEGKLVRCIAGRVHDVIVDLRANSASFCRHTAVQLDATNGVALYIPPGVAHGFQSLVDESTVLYMMTDRYTPELADGVRWNDEAFGIAWPMPVTCIAERDASYPDFDSRRAWS